MDVDWKNVHTIKVNADMRKCEDERIGLKAFPL